jgi:DegV family protein with EDD domain
MKIAIVSDSTCDIPAALVERHAIEVVPNLVVIDGKSLRDGIDITRQEFYNRMPQMTSHPTTATESSGVYQKLYERLLNQGAQAVISIHAASNLSGIFNAAQLAAREFGERVRVFDSESLTMGVGFQVLAAARASEGGASLDEIIQIVANVRRRVNVIAMLDTLEYVRRSGRVSWARARLGNLLQIKPFVEVRGGQVYSLGEARTRSKGIERLKERLLGFGRLEQLAILHTNAEGDALQFLKQINHGLPETPLIVNVTTVIGVHVGPNGLGFTAIPA